MEEIARSLAEELGLSQAEASRLVHAVCDRIAACLVREGRVEMRDFGIFEVKRRRARRGRNPRTGEQVLIPEKVVVTFKPGKGLSERVARLPQTPEGA
jgi:nucleoid DNA-binding protein